MGKTRTRVTFLVLSLESIGFLMLGVALYLAGGVRLSCEKNVDTGSRAVCQAVQKRGFGIFVVQDRRYNGVTGFATLPPALGRSDYWLSLETPERTERVLAGGQARTEKEAAELNEWLHSNSKEPFQLSRSAAPWALGTAFFGCIWIFVISLIMREFLGYHTPWWWRALKPKD